MLLINEYTPVEGYDPTVRPWYTAAMEEKPAVSIGLPYREAKTQEWLISQSKVLKARDGSYNGVVAIDCSMEEIVTLMEEKSLYESQRTYIMEENGKIIIHPDEEYIDQKIPQIKAEITGQEGELSYTLDGKETWGYYNTLDATGWIVATAVDRSEIMQPLVLRILSYTLIGICLILFLGILHNKVFQIRLARPLISLSQRVKDITQGKPKTETAETAYKYSNHEIAALAETIEQLAEDSLNKKANELRAIIESTGDGILLVNNDRRAIYTNSRLHKMWGIPQDVIVAAGEQALFDAIREQLQEPEAFLEKTRKFFSSGEKLSETIYFSDGRVFESFSRPLSERGEFVGRLWSFRDVTDQKRAEDKLRLMATTDELTGLWNRRFFMQELEKETERARRYNQVFSLMMLDIDHFKNINDTFGHGAGDYALQHLATIIIDNKRKVDITGRLGGEEFGIILPGIGLEDSLIVAERLRSIIEKDFIQYDGNNINYNVSIGVTANTGEILSKEEMLKKADNALYMAKAKGKNCVQICV